MSATVTGDENLILIQEIKARPALWDQQCIDHHNREVTDGVWEELSQKYAVSVEHLKTKWIGLRSQFRKSYFRQIKLHRSNPRKKSVSMWKYFVPLLFLKNQMKKLKPKPSSFPSSSTQDSDDEISDEMLREFESMETEYEDNIASNAVKFELTIQPSNSLLDDLLESFQKDMETLEKEKISTIDDSLTDGDLLFLHSLLPYMKSLSMTRKLILRTKIQSLICNFISNLDDKYFETVASNFVKQKSEKVSGKEIDNSICIEILDQSQILRVVETTNVSEKSDDMETIEVEAQLSRVEHRSSETFCEDNMNMEETVSLNSLQDDSNIWLLNVGQ